MPRRTAAPLPGTAQPITPTATRLECECSRVTRSTVRSTLPLSTTTTDEEYGCAAR